MIDLLANNADAGYMLPWSFLFATALIASALDIFSRRLLHPVVVTTWFFGLSVGAALGSWSIPELTAATICLMAPHVLICSFAARTANAKREVADPPAPSSQASDTRDTFVLQPPKPVSKPERRAA